MGNVCRLFWCPLSETFSYFLINPAFKSQSVPHTLELKIPSTFTAFLAARKVKVPSDAPTLDFKLEASDLSKVGLTHFPDRGGISTDFPKASTAVILQCV